MTAQAARPQSHPRLWNRSPRFWLRVAGYTLVAGTAIALPARLIPNDLFRRMTPIRPLDYVFWIASSILVGVLLALPRTRRTEGSSLLGGTATFLAVGCPICNRLVVAAIGVSGALNLFAPIQPILGLAALAFMAWAIRRGLRAPDSCELPRVDAFS